MTSPIPTLAAILASGAMVLGCHELVCGDTRASELEIHGRNASGEFKEGNLSVAVDEVGIALGLLPHASLPPTIAAPFIDPTGVTRSTTSAPAPSVTHPATPGVPEPSVPIPLGRRRRSTARPATPPHALPSAPNSAPHSGSVVGWMGIVTLFPRDRRTV